MKMRNPCSTVQKVKVSVTLRPLSPLPVSTHQYMDGPFRYYKQIWVNASNVSSKESDSRVLNSSINLVFMISNSVKSGVCSFS